jgi:hypothetical protein
MLTRKQLWIRTCRLQKIKRVQNENITQHQNKVRFKIGSITFIPSISDMKKDNLIQDLWYSDEEYAEFRNIILDEINSR